MIDLHTHVLPGIDDGPSTWEEAIALCRQAASDGTTTLVATPHQQHPFWSNDDLRELARLRQELQEQLGPTPRIVAGGEVHLTPGFYEQIDLLPNAQIEPLAGSRYLLLELPRTAPPAGLDPEALFHEVLVSGYRPILAHPELIPWLAEDLELLTRLAHQGCLSQITAMSVLGQFGRRAQKTSRQLVELGLAHFVASDCHDTRVRPPGLRAAYRDVASRYGVETAQQLFLLHPQCVLEDRPLPEPGRGPQAAFAGGLQPESA